MMLCSSIWNQLTLTRIVPEAFLFLEILGVDIVAIVGNKHRRIQQWMH